MPIKVRHVLIKGVATARVFVVRIVIPAMCRVFPLGLSRQAITVVVAKRLRSIRRFQFHGPSPL